MCFKATAVFVGFMLLAAAFLVTDVMAAEDWNDADDIQENGPVAMRNEMPLYLFFLQMRPDVAGVKEQGQKSVDVGYTVSNITVSGFTPTGSINVVPIYEVEIDLEVSRLDLDFRYGIFDNLEVGIELPIISLSQGYMDSFIEDFEDFVGARTPRSRVRQGTDNFAYQFKYDGNYLINETDSKAGIGDIVLKTKYQFLRDERGSFIPNMSARAELKLPTGSDSDLLGSGKLDFGLGVVLDKRLFNRFFIFGGANMMFVQKPDVFDAIAMDEVLYNGVFAMEYFITDRFSVGSQVQANSAIYPHEANINVLDNAGYDYALTFNYRFKRFHQAKWRFSCFENISAASTPDVSFNTSLKVDF